ncbi:MAG: hypothetical protein ACI3YC_08800, partial [Alloprevotella sp.]
GFAGVLQGFCRLQNSCKMVAKWLQKGCKKVVEGRRGAYAPHTGVSFLGQRVKESKSLRV